MHNDAGYVLELPIFPPQRADCRQTLEGVMSEFAGKVIVITGGGSGIGRGTALLFGREKSHVAVIDWNDPNGQETVNLIQGAGGQGLFIKADVSNSLKCNKLCR